jgi:hypothetical protein
MRVNRYHKKAKSNESKQNKKMTNFVSKISNHYLADNNNNSNDNSI